MKGETRSSRKSKSRREFLSEMAAAGAGLAAAPLLFGGASPASAAPPPPGGGGSAPPLAPSPGAPRPWQAGYPVYSGIVNLATGNCQLAQPVCGWGGRGGGLQLTLYCNSQSGRSSALGAKWSHSFLWKIVGTNPAVVVAGDGTETSYTLSGGQYVAPAGVYDRLVRNGDSTWTLTLKGGVEYRFRTDGLLGSIVDPNGNTLACTWTGGNLTQVTDPLNNVTQYVWQNTKLTQRTDARSRTTNYSYDAWGRLIGIAYPVSANITLAYDAEGRLTSATDGTGTRTWTYDTWGRAVAQTSPAGNTSATYDAAGRLLTQTDVTARQIQYGYDAAGRLNMAGDGAGSAFYGYTPDGQPDVVTYPNGTQVEHGYDAAGRVTGLTHRRTLDASVIVGYAAQYDDAGRPVQITEQPSGDITTFGYDDAGRMLSEARIGARPYSGEYQYNSRGLRTWARRIENGVTSHDGTYSYDDAGRLTQVVDAATQATELYAWNADDTLASYPGPGYARLLDYDEEGRLTRIRRDYGGGNVQLAYEYAYGYDGRRRWRKDYLQGVWTRYPCGVACCAGDLVEQVSDLSGAMWQTSALSLRGLGLVRRNSEFHHFDILGAAGVITDGNAVVLSDNLYDAFGVQRYAQGQALTPWRWARTDDEGFVTMAGAEYSPARAVPLQRPGRNRTREDCYRDCDKDWNKALDLCRRQLHRCLAAAGNDPILQELCRRMYQQCVQAANTNHDLCYEFCRRVYPLPTPRTPRPPGPSPRLAVVYSEYLSAA
jgi:YD repeat-containing protein